MHHRVCTLVRIGSPPPPLAQASVPSPEPMGGHTRLRVRGWEVPIRTTGVHFQGGGGGPKHDSKKVRISSLSLFVDSEGGKSLQKRTFTVKDGPWRAVKVV